MHPLVLVVGPTASGKSDLALRLARMTGGSILNCDSLQVYRRLEIGTAKPSRAERASLPHFLFDIREPGELLTAGDFRREALDVLARELPKAPVFGVGGSGFYIQALEKGMFDVPKADETVDAQVRAEVESHGLTWAHAQLATLDPESAKTIHAADKYRIVRALVILRETGRKPSELRRSFTPEKFPYPLIKIGLNPERESLRSRVQARTQAMLNDGLLEEVQTLLNEGFGEWPPLQSVGYREAVECLRGDLDRNDLAPKIVEKTMQLAKKQRTWFRRDPEITWFTQSDLSESQARSILARIKEF